MMRVVNRLMMLNGLMMFYNRMTVFGDDGVEASMMVS
jgi:hypothetical protein